MVRFFVWVIGFYLCLSATAFACSCNETDKVSQTVERTPVIFQGTVVELPKSFVLWSGKRTNIKFKVTHIYKGDDVEKYEYVFIPNVNAAGCAMRFRVGNKALIFAHKMDGQRGLSTSTCAKGHYFKDADYLNYLENGVDKENAQRKKSNLSFKYRGYLYPWESAYSRPRCGKGTNTLSAIVDNYTSKNKAHVKATDSLKTDQLWHLSSGYFTASYGRKNKHHYLPAITYLKMTADRQGSGESINLARTKLGGALTNCRYGLSQDMGMAREYLERAAEEEHNPAMHMLAMLHLQQNKGHYDPKVAQKYLERCVELGNKGCIHLTKVIEKRKSIDLESDTEFATFYREQVRPNLR